MKITYLFLMLGLILGGCNSLDYTIAKKSDIDKQIADARASTQVQLTDQNSKQLILLNQQIDTLKQTTQAASDKLFPAEATLGTLSTPDRPETIIGFSVNQTATYLPPAAPAVQAATFATLKDELNEAKTTNAQLQTKYDADMAATKADALAKQKAIDDSNASLKQVELDKQTILAKGLATEETLNGTKSDLQEAQIAKAEQAAKAAQDNQKMIIWMVSIFTFSALVCGAAAIFSPVEKTNLGIAAATCLALAIFIVYVKAWMVITAGGVIFLVIGFFIVKNYCLEHGTATDVYRALNEVKTTATADYNKVVAPVLASWQVQSTPAGTVPDTKALALVASRLKEVGDT